MDSTPFDPSVETSHSPYVYRPLRSEDDNTPHDIRFFRIMPRNDGSLLMRIYLEYTCLDDHLCGYTALSYTWGDSSPPIYIEVNDCAGGKGMIGIGQNLYDFLAMRQQTSSVASDAEWLWVDRLCIDQSNLSERSSQVAMMNKIYFMSGDVAVWLGNGFEGSDLLVQDIRKCESEMGAWLLSKLWSPVDEEVMAFRRAQMIPLLPSLQRLLELPYWSRLWICQEIVLGSKITVCIGHHRLHWDTHFTYFARSWLFTTILIFWDLIGPNSNHGRLANLSSMRYLHRNSCGPLGWHELCPMTKETKCTDQRDRFYGLLGLVHKSVKVQADYTKDLRTVYLDVMQLIIDQLPNGHSVYSVYRTAKWWRKELALEHAISTAEFTQFLRNGIFVHKHPLLNYVRYMSPRFHLLGFLIRTDRYERLKKMYAAGK